MDKVNSLEILNRALVDGDQVRAIDETNKLLASGLTAEDIVINGLEKAMVSLSNKCTAEAFNLLEIMLVGRACMTVLKRLFPLQNKSRKTKATVVLASPEGDVHDLGKNILKTVLMASGFQVIDAGKDCPTERMIDLALQEKALAIGVSGLITTVIPQVRKIVPVLEEQGGRPDIRVMAGGAALKQSTAEDLNVDFLAVSAFDAVPFLESIIKNKEIYHE